MKFIAKYSIGLYLIVSLLFKLNFIISHSFVNLLFYTLMGFGVLITPIYYKTLYGVRSMQTFWIFHAINLLNLIYFLTFDIGNLKSLLYLLGKYAGYNLIILGLVTNFGFYKRWFVKYFKFVMLFMLVAGTVFGVETEEDTRLSIGFNPNDVGLFALFGLFSIITFNRNWVKNRMDLLLTILFLIVALLSGSKATLLGIGLVTFLNFGVSYKSFGFALVFVVAFLITGSFGYTTSIDRLLSPESAFATRDDAFRIGLITFFERFWGGNGLDKYGWTNPIYYSDLSLAYGPHNSYLSIGIMYGVIFGSVFLILLLGFLIRVRSKALKYGDNFVRFAYYFLLLVMVNGVFETLIVGVNEFMTILFWFFIGVVAMFFSLNQKKKHAAVN